MVEILLCRRGRGIVLECVDFGNYKPEVRDAIAETLAVWYD